MHLHSATIVEVTRRDTLSAQMRAQRARLDPAPQLEAWDATANVRFDAELWNEPSSLRFLETHAHVAIVGPVGPVGRRPLTRDTGALVRGSVGSRPNRSAGRVRRADTPRSEHRPNRRGRRSLAG